MPSAVARLRPKKGQASFTLIVTDHACPFCKTYDTPYLSMEHGKTRAVISYPGYRDLIVDFKQP